MGSSTISPPLSNYAVAQPIPASRLSRQQQPFPPAALRILSIGLAILVSGLAILTIRSAMLPSGLAILTIRSAMLPSGSPIVSIAWAFRKCY